MSPVSPTRCDPDSDDRQARLSRLTGPPAGSTDGSYCQTEVREHLRDARAGNSEKIASQRTSVAKYSVRQYQAAGRPHPCVITHDYGAVRRRGTRAAHASLTDPTADPATVVAECVAAGRDAMEEVANDDQEGANELARAAALAVSPFLSG